MQVDLTLVLEEIERLDEQLDGIRIEELFSMGLSDFSIFSLAPADLEMARKILLLSTRGEKRRAEEMEQALLVRIKKQLVLAWGRREWLRGVMKGVNHLS